MKIALLSTALAALSYLPYSVADVVSNHPPTRRASCSSGGTSANGRTVAYWPVYAAQPSTNNGVQCGLAVSSINTNGVTHLNLAFAVFNSSYAVVPASSGDTQYYSQFTALQSKGVQTWISLGGGSFSNDASTSGLWSQMVSTSANRAAFISSLASFLAKYNFQGVDIDWETPLSSADVQNCLLLVQQMRSTPAFGNKYGISFALPPIYNGMTYFNIQGMASSVSFYNYMAYDLAAWAYGSKNLESQTDVRLIESGMNMILNTGVSPAQINLGTAVYGRGYTVSNSGCTTLGCPASGPSSAGPCSNSAGILTLNEINSMISKNKITPTLDQQAASMQFVYGNQWFSYDNQYTLYLKKLYADSLCLGGMMVWSIDQDGGIGNFGTPALANPSTNACGASANNAVCTLPPPWGQSWSGSTLNCCSQYGYCGSTSGYCSPNCQSGNCAPVTEYSTNNQCGSSNNGLLCYGSGECCSVHGWCGTGSTYCGSGCQSGACS